MGRAWIVCGQNARWETLCSAMECAENVEMRRWSLEDSVEESVRRDVDTVCEHIDPGQYALWIEMVALRTRP
jgi:hypothetical protein